MSDFPKPQPIPVEFTSPADRARMSKALREVADLIESGAQSNGFAMLSMPFDTSLHLTADLTLSLVPPGEIQ